MFVGDFSYITSRNFSPPLPLYPTSQFISSPWYLLSCLTFTISLTQFISHSSLPMSILISILLLSGNTQTGRTKGETKYVPYFSNWSFGTLHISRLLLLACSLETNLQFKSKEPEGKQDQGDQWRSLVFWFWFWGHYYVWFWLHFSFGDISVLMKF